MSALPTGGRVAGVSKIAVLRANAIGDLVFALPALESLRAAYPTAEIVLLGQAWHAGFLTGRPGPVDRVVVVPASRGVNDAAGPEDPAELARFFDNMRRERFDLALQLHGGGRHSNPFVGRLGARLTAGLRAPDAEPLDRWVPYVYFQPEVLRYLEVVRLVGAESIVLEPSLCVTERDLAEAAAILAEAGERFVVLHPGAGDVRRRWPPEKFAALGDELASAGYAVVVTGGRADERPLAEAVLRNMRARGVDAFCRLSLGGLAGMLSRCELLVSNDSGPLHVGIAVGAPTVGLYWCCNLVTASPPMRTNHRPIVSWRLDCPTCGRDAITDPCRHEVSLVAGVPVAEVLAVALDLLGSVPQPAQPSKGVPGA
jgi:ADP-heptose:LPS heptosyltransferase